MFNLGVFSQWNYTEKLKENKNFDSDEQWKHIVTKTAPKIIHKSFQTEVVCEQKECQVYRNI